MWISRVRVNGGFLAGFDVRLDPGLNVVVGPRGAGKTTLLELIRHALGIPHADEGQAKRQHDAIVQLLGAGEVVLELEDSGSSRHLVVDATGSGRSLNTASSALALGQNELERIASSPASRLNLIDLRASVDARPPQLEKAPTLTQQLANTRLKIDQLTETSARRAVLLSDRATASVEERRLLDGTAVEIAQRREVLREIEAEMLQLGSQVDVANSTREATLNAIHLGELLDEQIADLVQPNAGVALTALVDPIVEAVAPDLVAIRYRLQALRSSIEGAVENMTSRENMLRVQAEPVRAELEVAEVGLGQVTARLRNIDSELALLDRSDDELQELRTAYSRVKSERDSVLDEYELWQESLYEARQNIAADVSDDLRHRVVVSVQHLADSSRFRDALIDLLQGSGLQFRPLSEALAKSLLPRQLLTLVEEGHVDTLATSASISVERAARVIAHLQTSNALSTLATCALDDSIDFRLRDGAIEKSVEDLSTGQKCAVTLPIVLTERSRVLILDQPEDHLDNAYLVDHVVHALERRGESGGQTIVATHNANIPVLGSAPLVVSLDSDGNRGFVSCSGPFEDGPIVDVITTLMEGGRDAFRRRARFYAEHEDGDA